MNNTYILLGIATMSIVTIVLRFLPFVFLKNDKEYKTLNYLGNVLPCAIMAMLVVYCLKDISFTNVNNYVPTLIACTLVSITYIVSRKTLLSIIFGTAIYMILVQFVFI